MALSAAEEALVRELIAENPQLLSLADNEATIISKLGATKKNLSELAAALSLNDTDLAFVRQGSSDKSVALSVLKAFAVAAVPAASETVSGIAELATTAEATAGTDDLRIMTPLKVAQSIAANAKFAQIQPIPTPTLSANALTVPSAEYKLDFRKSTLGSGGVDTVSGSPSALTIPAGATLGAINAQKSSIILLVLNNAGTLEYAVVNLAGGVDLSETGLISTTAISASATSASAIYSNTARTNVPYRVVGRIDSTQATAGQWATAPSLVQGYGGQAIDYSASMVRLNTANGYGSTGTKIRRFTNTVVNQGADITYEDSATLGASFTINSHGVYAISYSDQGATAMGVGLSLNASSLTTNIQSLPVAELLVMSSSPAANGVANAKWTGFLKSGDIIRPHTDGIAAGANVNAVQFTIIKIR